MLRKLLAVAVALLLLLTSVGLGCESSPTSTGEKSPSEQTIKWRMATSWPPDSFWQIEGAQAFADRVAELSGGRLLIEVYPAGSIMGALDVFDAVSSGTVEAAHSWSGYWRGKDPAFELFSSIPNQMTLQEWAVWLYGPARGIDLWREFYQSYNVIPFPGGLTGPEFGFFTNKPVRSVEDFKGLNLRVSGMAAGVVEELGASVTLTPAGEIRAAMENGEIDGFELSTPAIDWQLGFQQMAGYVAWPSWHQPSAMVEIEVNRDAWARLPADLKAIFEAASKEVSIVDYMAALEGANADHLKKFEQYGTQIIPLDVETTVRIKEIASRLADEQAARDPFYARVLESQRGFLRDYRAWEKWGDYKLYAANDLAIVFDVRELESDFVNGVLRGAREAALRSGGKVDYATGDSSQFEGSLRNLARAGKYALIISVGSGDTDALDRAAGDFPEQRFLAVDSLLDGKPNVTSLLFRDEESSFLAGAAAALASKTGKVGFVGGIDLPVIQRFLAGYRAGVRHVNPGYEVLVSYVGSWSDREKGRMLAEAQIELGADVVFGAAGSSSLGVIEAAKERGLYVIGVDADQRRLAPGNVLASTLKSVDVAVSEASSDALTRYLVPGIRSMGLKEGAVGIALNDSLPEITGKVIDTVEKLKSDIIAGRIETPSQ